MVTALNGNSIIVSNSQMAISRTSARFHDDVTIVIEPSEEEALALEAVPRAGSCTVECRRRLSFVGCPAGGRRHTARVESTRSAPTCAWVELIHDI